MTIIYLLIATASAYLNQYLHTSPALYLDCQNTARMGQNAYIGDKYFYKYLSNNGANTDLSKLTFQIWAKFYSINPKQDGKQIVFSFVDGPSNNPHINIQLYFVSKNNQLYLGLKNGLVTDDPIVEMKIGLISNTDSLNDWNQITVAIDQSGSTAYTNLKLYQSSLFYTHVDQTPYPNSKPFTYQFTEQSRITNEQFLEQENDIRACAYIANFEYYIGWVAMHTETYVDYQTKLKFYLKPLSGSAINLSTESIVKQSQSGVEFSGPVGLRIYKDTQIEFVYTEQLTSFTLSFWLNSKAESNFQLISFSQDSLLEPTFGFGVNSANRLQLLQSKSRKAIGQLNVGWNSVVASVYLISRSSQFTPTTSLKKLVVQINGVAQDVIDITGFSTYQRIIIGFINRGIKDTEFVDIQEIKLFMGSGTYSATGDCLLFIGIDYPYCLRCNTPGNHYCQENQDPTDDANYFICPAKQKQVGNTCVAITIANCLRVSGSICTICEPGYTLSAGSCTGAPIAFQQACNDRTLYCKWYTQGYSSLTMNAIVCKTGNKYNQKKCVSGTTLTNCANEGVNGCYVCSGNTMLSGYECLSSCTPTTSIRLNVAYRFNDVGKCRQYCPSYATYKLVCELGWYEATCTDVCPTNGIQLPGSCGTSESLQVPNNTPAGYHGTLGCFFKVSNGTRQTVQITKACDPQCEYCYHFNAANCLSCRSPYYYDKVQTLCLEKCDLGELLRYTNEVNKVCEYSCPVGTFTLDFTCVAVCPTTYYAFGQTCYQEAPPSTYLQVSTSKYILCPQICKTCTSATVCNSCVNNYPMYSNMCLSTCLPMYLKESTNTCVSSCLSTEYVYETTNLNGFAFKVCFASKCGTVIANSQIQTVAHQTILRKCMQPCDSGYFADYSKLKCMPCTNNCKTCIDKESYCLSCPNFYFLDSNTCPNKCTNGYQNYLNNTCVSQCTSGYTINENGIKACVSSCGVAPYTNQKYSYNMYCYMNKPTGSLYCVGYNCYDCHYSCTTCSAGSDSDCTSCTDSYLNAGRCGNTCPNMTDTVNKLCVNVCPSGSKIYQNYCVVSCYNNTYQYGDNCTDNQPTGTYCYSKEGYSLCKECSSNCSGCTSKLSTDCTACVVGYYYYNSRCYSKCPSQKPYMQPSNQMCVDTCDPQYSENNYCTDQCSANAVEYEPTKLCLGTGCPIGTYQYIWYGRVYCLQCNSKCITCTGSSNTMCQTCATNYYLSGSTCDSVCPTSTYYNDLNYDCRTSCPSLAFIYNNNGVVHCIKECPNVYYWKLCLDSCPIETFPAGKECQSCASECSICFGSNVNQCTKCDSGLYLDNTTCVFKCPPERPYANLADFKCLATCPIYTNQTDMTCMATCSYQFQFYELNGKKECVTQCYANSFVSGQNCVPCSPECVYCSGTTANTCISCSVGYYLDNTTCSATCPYLYDQINRKCMSQCPPDLVTNLVTSQCVLQCPSGQVVYNQICQTSCPTYTYKTGTICYDCNQLCTTCTGSEVTQCKSCITNYYLNGSTCQLNCPILHNMVNFKCESFCPTTLYTNDQTKQCVATCPTDYLVDQSLKLCLKACFDGTYNNAGKCEACHTSCELCSTYTKCTQCAEGYYLEIMTCINLCSNTELYMDPFQRVCQSRCKPPQLHYTAYGRGFCVSECPSTHSVLDQFCVSSCPDGYYSDSLRQCKQCPSSCLICTSFSICTHCITGNYLNNDNSCAPNCGSQYLNKITNLCVSNCQSNEITYNNTCLSICPTNPVKFEYNNECYDQCPTKTFRKGQQCVDCASECSECNGLTSDDCLSCVPNYYLDGSKCATTCPAGLLKDLAALTCVITCHPLQFLQSGQCITMCPNVSYQKVCMTSCPASTYTFGQVCVDCAPECQDCNDTECILCKVGYYSSNGVCGTYCPVVYDDVNRKCAIECIKPLYRYVDQCISACPTVPIVYYYYGQLCVRDCPAFTALNGMDCLACEERCLLCNTPTQCTVCTEGYYLYNGVCLVSCPQLLPINDSVNWKCQSACPVGTYYHQEYCVSSCSNKIYNKMCVNECPVGYYGDNCSLCRSECKSCTSYQSCQSCSPNYFLEQDQCDTTCPLIKDTLTWTCTDKCLGLLYMNTCLSECPDNTTKQGKLCTTQCNPGYYQSDKVCLTCPKECVLCTSDKLCQSCSLGYYLNGTKCGDKCPSPLYGNYKEKTCVVQCPKNTYAHNGFCLFSCPKGYLTSGSECTLSCSSNKVRSLNSCLDCPVECKECTAVSNANCKSCAAGFKLEADLCRGVCPSGYVEINQMCQKCAYQCKSCETTIDKCKTCRGDRKGADCLCPKGYFDDQFNDSCQQCPCLECTDEANCTVCKNNLKTPNCSCDRWLNDDWCVTCLVGRVNVVFSDDLNSVIIDFGYYISIDLINPFQPSDCAQWFNNYNKFGLNSTCYLGWDRDQVIINLGKAATIEIGDQLSFKKQFYKDVNDASCEGFIEYFIDTTVNAPVYQMKPYVMFDVPGKVSTCMEFNISQVSVWGTGNRDLKVLKWDLLPLEDMDHFYELEYWIQKQNTHLNIPVNTLKPNTTYVILANYVNMLGRVNSTKITFTAIPQQKPYVYVTFSPLIVKAYIFDCHVTYSDLQSIYTLGVLISKNNETLISEQIFMTDTFQLAVNESLLPRGQEMYLQAYAEDSIIDLYFTLPLFDYNVSFYQNNRFLGTQGQINARGYDYNVYDKVAATMNFTYQWRCTNLYNLQPCKTVSNQIITFANSRVLQINVDSANTTFAFYCKVIKNKLWSTREQIIVITDLNIEMGFNRNIDPPSGKINMNNDLFLLLKQPQQYAMIMHDYKLIGTLKIVGDSLKFKLADYLNKQGGSDIVSVYLIPGNESLKFTINSVAVEGQIYVSPESGSALDQYTVSTQLVGLNLSELTYTYFYYDSYKKLVQDVSGFSIMHGKPLGLESGSASQQVFLPNGIADNLIYVLCQVRDLNGGISYFNKSVSVMRTDYTLSELINTIDTFINQASNSKTNLQTISAALELLKLEQKQVCLKQCSGVGTCIDRKCVCPTGYYFDDCSGKQESYQKFNEFLSKTLSNLIDTPFDDNVSFKMFVSSLKSLMSYPIIYDKFDIQKSKLYLNGLIANLQSRLNKINEFAINIQFQSTDDFNYDQLDIQSIISITDLQKAVYCTDLVWSVLLFGQTSTKGNYEISYKLRQSLEIVAELSFTILQPDESIDYSSNGIYFTVNRTTKIEQINSNRPARILQSLMNTPSTNNSNLTNTTSNSTTNSTTSNVNNSTTITNTTNTNNITVPIVSNETTINTQYFDIVQAIYVRNLYFSDGYFPYPDQVYPLYDYQIRKINRKGNIQLKYNMNYTFNVQQGENFVCIRRDSYTYEWTNDNCETNWTSTQVNCNCSILAPTTIVNDYNYIFNGSKSSRIEVPNIILPIIFGQLAFWFIIFIIGVRKDGDKFAQVQQEGRQIERYGFTQKLVKNRDKSQQAKDQFGFEENSDTVDDMVSQRKLEVEVEAQPQVQTSYVNKYSVNQFKNYHCVLNVIYKYKKYLPRWFRASLLLFRWTAIINLAGTYSYLSLQYEVSVFAVLGTFIVSRICERGIRANYQQANYKQQYLVKILLLMLILLVIVLSTFGIILEYQIIEKQSDWIVSYVIAFLVDIATFDLIYAVLSQFLGDAAKKALRKKAHNIRKLHEIKMAAQKQKN